jgi:hypothetical protein
LEDPFQGHERQSLQIEHYECCHKPLPEFSNIESLSVVHHALGFLPDPTQREVLLEEIDSDEDEDVIQKPSKQIHCIKVINGELILFCNIKTRSQFKTQPAFAQAASCEITLDNWEKQPTMQNNILPVELDIKGLVDGLTLPMTEEQLGRNQKTQFQYDQEGSKSLSRTFIGLM